MASPQCEDGYTRIANELLDALAMFTPGYSQGQVLFAVLRKTYGWHKKEDFISVNQIVDLTLLSRRTVIYAIQNLEAKKMIKVKRLKGRGNRNKPNLIAINKNYDEWIVQGISEQYDKLLKRQRERYKKSCKKVVQGKRKTTQTKNTAKKTNPCTGVVQRNDGLTHNQPNLQGDYFNNDNQPNLQGDTSKAAKFLAPTKEKTIQKKSAGPAEPNEGSPTGLTDNANMVTETLKAIREQERWKKLKIFQ